MTTQEKLKQLKPEKIIDTKDIDQFEDLCKTTWRDLKMQPPNANQLGVAIAAALDLESKHKRQLWDVPPGLGKSRIIGALAVFLKTRKKPCDISIVFPSEILLETDREMYTKIATMLSIEIKLHVGLTVEELDAIRPNTLLILDEGDWYLLD